MSLDTNTDTATITTATATVRTLMVGARQVTLSVYRQLDEVLLEHMTPMGRVNDVQQQKRTDSDYGGSVVGRSEDGTLVRAGVYAVTRPVLVTEEDLTTAISVCRRYPRETRGRFVELPGDYRHAGHRLMVDGSRVVDHTCYHRPGPCNWSPTDAQRIELDAAVAAHEAEDAPHAAARGLPLIVLAGLR